MRIEAREESFYAHIGCKKEKIIFALNNFIESGDEDLYKRFPTIMLIYSRYKRQMNKYTINTIYFAIYN